MSFPAFPLFFTSGWQGNNDIKTKAFLILAVIFCFSPGCGNNGVDTSEMYDYVCQNGTPRDGMTQTQNDNKCKACNSGYALDSNEQCVSGYRYTCTNGTPRDGITQTQNDNKCKACDFGYALASGQCTQETTYPLVQTGIEYIGLSPGLTITSSEQDFFNGLDSTLSNYINQNPSDSDSFIIDNTTYRFGNTRTITGGVPANVFTEFWNDLESFSYSIGSCWIFFYYQIPSKRGNGTIYYITAIIYDIYTPRVYYRAVETELVAQ